jgi:curved DNA-binding protein CbpA
VSTTTTQVLDPFDVLGLTPGGKEVTAAEVRKAYRKLALSLHPDKAAQNGMIQSRQRAG